MKRIFVNMTFVSPCVRTGSSVINTLLAAQGDTKVGSHRFTVKWAAYILGEVGGIFTWSLIAKQRQLSWFRRRKKTVKISEWIILSLENDLLCKTPFHLNKYIYTCVLNIVYIFSSSPHSGMSHLPSKYGMVQWRTSTDLPFFGNGWWQTCWRHVSYKLAYNKDTCMGIVLQLDFGRIWTFFNVTKPLIL